MTDAGPTETPMTFTDDPRNPLEEMLYTGLADPTQMGAFEQTMLEADLYAVPEPDSPGGTPGDDGSKVLRPGEQLILRGVELNDGRNTVTLFTDPSRAIEMFGDDTRVLAMRGRNLLDMLKDTVVLMNPAGGKGLMMEPDQIKSLLADAPAPPHVRPTGRVELHAVEPENEPVLLTGALRPVLQPPQAEAVWVARAVWPEVGLIGWFVDVRTDRPADEIYALVQRAVRGLPFGLESLDVSVSKPGGKDGIGVKLG
jgi:hypothetical protein